MTRKVLRSRLPSGGSPRADREYRDLSAEVERIGRELLLLLDSDNGTAATQIISDAKDYLYVLIDGTRPLTGDWTNRGKRLRETGVAEVSATEPTNPAIGLIWVDTDATGTGGMGSLAITTLFVSTTLTASQTMLRCDTTLGAQVQTLPAAASNRGKVFYIKNTGSPARTVTVDGNALETIDGGLTAVLTDEDEAISIVSDGSNWGIFT